VPPLRCTAATSGQQTAQEYKELSIKAKNVLREPQHERLLIYFKRIIPLTLRLSKRVFRKNR